MHQGGYMKSKSVFRDRKQLDVAGAPHQVQMGDVSLDAPNNNIKHLSQQNPG